MPGAPLRPNGCPQGAPRTFRETPGITSVVGRRRRGREGTYNPAISSDSLNLGCAISINALALDRRLFPFREATPYSVTT